MPIITFWSNNEKAIGQTVAASCTATVMAMEHNYKVLLVSADFNNESMEEAFGAQESNRELVKTLIKTPQVNIGSGIEGMLKLAESNRVTPEVIHDYTKIVFKNRLEILYSPKKIEDLNRQVSIMESFKNIILNAAKYYDQVIVDLKKGTDFSAEILNISDVVIANINQASKKIEEMVTSKEIQELEYKTIWNVCKCDINSKYNAKNLTRNILRKQVVYETDYNTLILEASQEGNIAEILLRFRSIKQEDNNYIFYKNIKNLTEEILNKYQQVRMKL